MMNSRPGSTGLWRTLALSIALVALPVSGAFAKSDVVAEGVNVGKAPRLAHLVPAAEVENAAGQQYHELLQQAAAKRALAPPDQPQLQRIRAVAKRLIPQAPAWNDRAASWNWEVNLIGSNQINAFCMPGGKIVFYSGILDQLRLTDDEIAMVMGHEMAHALREHARERLAKDALTNVGAQLLSLKFSRSDESEADLVAMEIAARAGYDPRAAITLWKKMGRAGKASPPQWISTHPSSSTRIARLQKNLPRVMPLYQRARSQ
jgi:predicted Zn-dependent protease